MHNEEAETCSTSYSTSDAEPSKKMVVQLWQNLFAPGRANVTFVCKDGVRARCNRSALSAASRFFDSLLSKEWRESAQIEIDLPLVDAHLLENYVFEHFRTGSGPVAAETDDMATVFNAYALARQYCLSSLEVLLLQELVRKMDICSAGWLLRRALGVQAEDLILLSLNHLARAWSQGVTGVAIIGMCPDALLQFLQSPMPSEQNIPQEHLLETIIEWGREQLDLSDGIWQGQISDQEREDLLELTEPLLAFVRLESIPAAVLESKIEPLGLYSQQQLLKVYRAQAKSAFPAESSTRERSFWDCRSMPSTVVLHDSSTTEFRIFDGHVGLRSKVGLTRGKWEWSLQFSRVGRKYAWAGVVDSSANLNIFPGSQFGGFMYGSGGLLRSKSPGVYDEEKKRVSSEWHRDGCAVTVHLDMDRRECGFSVDGAFVGILFSNLPGCVFPAVSLSGGGIVRFVSIDVAKDMPRKADPETS